jgi:hypothetical protein
MAAGRPLHCGFASIARSPLSSALKERKLIDIPKFKSPSLFCLAVGISLLAWYYTHAFVLLDKFMPLEFALQEELLITKAELEVAKTQSDQASLAIAEAKYNASEYKTTELKKVMGGAFELHSLALWIGFLFLVLALPAFFIEIGWQKSAFNQAVNRTPKA